MRLMTQDTVAVPADQEGLKFAVSAIFVFALLFIILWAVSRAGDLNYRETHDSHTVNNGMLSDQAARVAVISNVVDRVSAANDQLNNKLDLVNGNVVQLSGNVNTQFAHTNGVVEGAADRVIDIGQNQGFQTYTRVYPNSYRDEFDRGRGGNNVNTIDIQNIVASSVAAALAQATPGLIAAAKSA